MDVSDTPPLDVAQAKRILVVRTDHLGDLILSTPFLETLRRMLPRSRITALVTPYTQGALDGNPSVDEVLALEPKGTGGGRADVLSELKKARFDVCIALSPTMRAYSICRMLKAPVRAGYIYSRRWVPRALSGMLLTHRAVYHIDALVEKSLAVPHEVEQLLWFARMLGLSAEPVPLRLYPDPSRAPEVLRRLEDPGVIEEFNRSVHAPDWDKASRRDVPWVAVHLAPAWVRPPWSPSAFVDMLEALLADVAGCRVVVTFGPQEEDLGGELQRSYAGSERVRVMGHMTVNEWATVMGAARMAVTSDTGAIHVAAGVRTPVVAAYEDATFDLCSQQWAPWMIPHRKVRKTLPAETIPSLVEAAVRLWKPGR